MRGMVLTETIRFLCGKNYEPHDPHTWRSGFLWLDRNECDGLKEHRCTYDCSYPCGAKLYYGKTVNALRAEAGLPPYEPEEPHKHRLKLTSWQWSDNNQHGKLSSEAILGFSCKDGCVDPSGSLWKIKIHRWKYNNLVLANREVHQTWPQ